MGWPRDLEHHLRRQVAAASSVPASRCLFLYTPRPAPLSNNAGPEGAAPRCQRLHRRVHRVGPDAMPCDWWEVLLMLHRTALVRGRGVAEGPLRLGEDLHTGT